MSFHIYNAILIFGLVLILHTPHIKASVDYYNGAAIISTSFHQVIPTEFPNLIDLTNKDAICSNLDFSYKTTFASKFFHHANSASPSINSEVYLYHTYSKKTLTIHDLYLKHNVLRL